MKNIATLYSQAAIEKRQLISFEIFPPKGDLTMETAREVAQGIGLAQPDFVSVTYSAGGSGNKQATAEIVEMIQKDHNIPTMAHLTCFDATHDSIDAIMQDYRARGINNVLALHGDPIPGVQPADFTYSRDLIELLVDNGFCVGAAAYPEGHITCESIHDSISHLVEKQKAGASFFITQLFFDNEFFYRFYDSALNAGISVPISCGIMPFLSKSQITRMVFTCGASLPSPIIKLLAKWEHDPESLRKAGIEYAINQLIDLSDHGVSGLHVYSMNHPNIAQSTAQALRSHWQA